MCSCDLSDDQWDQIKSVALGNTPCRRINLKRIADVEHKIESGTIVLNDREIHSGSLSNFDAQSFNKMCLEK